MCVRQGFLVMYLTRSRISSEWLALLTTATPVLRNTHHLIAHDVI
jgi:hypothetical protein